MKIYLTVLVLLTAVSFSYSQGKLEREYRIKPSQVPVKALGFVEKSMPDVKVKWYWEENLQKKSIEAKGTRNGKLYSVEFDTLGVLQDVEVLVKYQSLPENTKIAIEKSIENRFAKFNIEKTQIQWVGDQNVLMSLIKGEDIGQTAYITNYEIMIKGSMDGRTDFYEVLLNEKGEIKRVSKVLQRNDYHLIY
ncbi:hypothetical protein IWX76_001840 [Pedobacter sp. CAN_A7]|uniref:hypothetical protein n=1 Tax=Pedobacter sp. CAN_A7 TaxID=2787722 RepID=UPI0018C91A1B